MQKRVGAFAQLGKVMTHLGSGDAWPGESSGLSRSEYEDLELLVNTANIANGWFTLENVRFALQSLGQMLDKQALLDWTAKYETLPAAKRVGVIMAGNIPLVGFHDLLCVLLSGHTAIVKYSSNDDRLLPGVLKVLYLFAPDLKDKVEERTGVLGEVDAVIATGSNNAGRYFEHYFGTIPHVIRKNRNSIAVISGKETEAELRLLGDDIFRYFGACWEMTFFGTLVWGVAM